MPKSIFNLTFQDKYNHSRILIFNTLSRRLLWLDENEYNAFSNDTFTQENASRYNDNGFIVPSEDIELDKFYFFYNRAKFYRKIDTAVIIPVFDCNLACTYCYQGAWPKNLPSKVMNEDIIERVIKWINRHQNVKLGFYGGEPTLASDIIVKIINSTRSNISLIFIITNGVHFSSLLSESIKDIKSVVQLTFAGDKARHDQYRPLKSGQGISSYELTKETLACLLLQNKDKLEIFIRIDITPDNVGSIEVLLEDLKKYNSKNIIIGFSPVVPFRNKNINIVSADKIALLYTLAIKLGFKVNRGNEHVRLFSFCPSNTTSAITISPNGKVFQCMGFADFPDQSVGVLSEDGEFIPNQHYFHWFRKNPLEIHSCRKCPVLPMCAGGCTMIAIQLSREGDKTGKGCIGNHQEFVYNVIKPYLENKMKCSLEFLGPP